MLNATQVEGDLSDDNMPVFRRQPMTETRLRWLFFLTLTLVLVALLAPAATILDAKIWLASWLPYAREIDASNLTQHADKWAHFTMFALLGLLGLRSWLSLIPIAHVLGGLALLALTTEWLQHYIPGRSASLSDLLADLVGLSLGLLAWRTLRPA